ncbi:MULTISPECIES: general secretion pathway protein GspB [unclassified Shewanella]|uniref:general secretion pathway protein GspB n=1 Tax=Shewanella TaxID=22 RepID=UPI0021D7D566|nr:MULTISPECIES: general secretion pathway protein GspB [unclassified Shewanella]MCU8002398.1 general secretion pathway protein GspB [Shewanella sp. SM96]MCU8061273.1 general secretion pathway protein GspB [Shewanella sp. SM55]MCU8086109.1 general secretion pathway protein GspB [Shewanella sp. SM21]
MSILLDAVTRNKQQQQSPLPDAVMTPRANYPQPRKSGVPIGKLSILVVAVAAGIGVAWGLSVWDKTRPPQSDTVAVANVLPSISSLPASTAIKNELQSTVGAASELQVEPSAASGVRLAGKVALPRTQTLPELTVSPQFQAETVVSNAPQMNASANITTNSVGMPAQSDSNSGFSDSSYADYMSTSAQVDAASQEAVVPAAETQAQQPMMLGANANESGLASLEALRQQVSAAAEDVGLETNKSRDEDKLVASFQNALKDVEYVNAAETNVTEAKLDPIPKTAVDEIPKYGQLPAGLQLQVPEFNIVAHVYSSDPAQRWLNVDGAELQEGDMIAGKLKIISIRPRDIVLDIQGTQFKVPAI